MPRPLTSTDSQEQESITIQAIKNYVKEHSYLLFKHIENNSLKAIFDNKGFDFTPQAKIAYDRIKSEPHLYVAWTNSKQGHYYIGKSFQKGGRWKREHAYHLGTLAYHLTNNIQKDDQNHAHWILNWMFEQTLTNIGNEQFSINLKKEVFISFIPFNIYSNQHLGDVGKELIKELNHKYEELLRESYKKDGLNLLNVQGNSVNTQAREKSTKSKKTILKQTTTHLGSNCIDFNIKHTESVHKKIQAVPLPIADKYEITISNRDNRNQLMKPGKTGDPKKYFSNVHSNNVARWKHIQNLMNEQKIKNAVVRVCPLSPDKTVAPVQESTNPKKIKTVKNLMAIQELEIRKDDIIVMCCASKKKPIGLFRHNNRNIDFKAVCEPRNGIYRPYDKIIPKAKTSWSDLISSPNVQVDQTNNLVPAYTMYQNSIYEKLFREFGGNLYILSAGWGLVKSTFRIPKYNITFSKTDKTPIETIRSQKDKEFNDEDFNHLKIKPEKRIIFLGGEEYGKQFVRLTENLKNLKIICYYNENNCPITLRLPNNTFTAFLWNQGGRRKWHYNLAEELISKRQLLNR